MVLVVHVHYVSRMFCLLSSVTRSYSLLYTNNIVPFYGSTNLLIVIAHGSCCAELQCDSLFRDYLTRRHLVIVGIFLTPFEFLSLWDWGIKIMLAVVMCRFLLLVDQLHDLGLDGFDVLGERFTDEHHNVFDYPSTGGSIDDYRPSLHHRHYDSFG